MLFHLRWNSVERPAPLAHEAFPYGEIRIGVDASYPPFAVDTGNNLFGLDIDLGNALSEEIDFPIRFINMGFDGLYDSIKADQVDMVISALLVDPAKMADVRYTQAYFDAGLVLVTHLDSQIETIEILAGYSLAYEFGSPADAEAREWERRLDDFAKQPYELPEYALDAVRIGEADAALVDATSYHLYQRDFPDWQNQISYVTHNPYAIAIRIDRLETWQAVNHALDELAEKGMLDTIFRRWL